MYDLLLKNAWVVDPLNSVNGVADVAIQDSKIAKVQRDITEEAKEVIDFTGKTLQPGIIDSHVHLGEMWGSPFGPRMLAMNGVTTCLDMAGPLENILDNVPKYGVGINMAILQFASPPFTFKDANPTNPWKKARSVSNSSVATIRLNPKSLLCSSAPPWNAELTLPGMQERLRTAPTSTA